MRKAIYLEHLNKFFDIQWRIGSKCNLNCEYCCATKNKHNYTEEELMNLLPNLNKLFEKAYKATGKKICFHPSGCEPTLWDLNDFFRGFDERYVGQVAVISNGTAPAETYKKWREIIEGKGIVFRLSFSWHEQRDVEAFIEKARECKCIMTKVVIADTDKYREEYEKLAALSHTEPIQACIVRIENGKADVTPERLELYNKFRHIEAKPKVLVKFDDGNTEMLHIHEYPSSGYSCDFRGYKCYAGTNRLTLTTRGKIRRGGACTGKNIGDIENIDDFEIPTEPFICESERACNLCSQPKVER